MRKEYQMKASDHTTVYVHVWPVEKPKGVILLSHGMTEHGLRYNRFGRFLQDNQIGLYCPDQRGHGKTGAAALGHLRKGVEWELMIDDLFRIKRDYIDKETSCPIYLMGHSMGSFLVRRAVELQPKLFNGLLLSGTGDSRGLAGKLAEKLAGIACLMLGEKFISKELKQLVFGTYNKQVRGFRTVYDWLTRDNIEVDSYLSDTYCGFSCTNGFYYELFRGIQMANDPKKIRKLKKEFPIYLFSGTADPVGTQGKGVRNVAQAYCDAGMDDITLRLYPGGRHEMLNELNRDMVMKELLQWLEQHIIEYNKTIGKGIAKNMLI